MLSRQHSTCRCSAHAHFLTGQEDFGLSCSSQTSLPGSFSEQKPSITGERLFSLYRVGFLTWSKTNSMDGDKQQPLFSALRRQSEPQFVSVLFCKDEPHFISGISWGKPSSTVKHCIFLLLSLLPRVHGCFLLSFIQLKGGSKGPR